MHKLGIEGGIVEVFALLELIKLPLSFLSFHLQIEELALETRVLFVAHADYFLNRSVHCLRQKLSMCKSDPMAIVWICQLLVLRNLFTEHLGCLLSIEVDLVENGTRRHSEQR